MEMQQKEHGKRRRGDRLNGTRVRGLDSMHMFLPLMLPNRADNEAFIQELIDLTALEAWLEKKNAAEPEHRYTLTHAMLAAFGRTIAMRPRINRYIAGSLYYDRNNISFSLIAKKAFSDNGDESIVILRYDPESERSSIDMMHDKLCKFVYALRKEGQTDNTTDILDTLAKLPRPFRRFVIWALRTLDYFGIMPKDLLYEDPYQSSVWLSNLGSIKLNAGYHHLTNWGTNSIFVVMGEKHLHPFYVDDGGVSMRPAMEIGLTLDERIADGYYYSRTVKLLKHLLTHPELLDVPAKEELSCDY